MYERMDFKGISLFVLKLLGKYLIYHIMCRRFRAYLICLLHIVLRLLES